MCIGLTSGLGRLAFGYIADHRGVNRILLQQLSFVAMGLLTIAIPLIESFPVLIGISLCMGIFDGCFISLLGPVAYDLCGAQGATQAIGFLLGLCSVPLTGSCYGLSFVVNDVHFINENTLWTLKTIKTKSWSSDCRIYIRSNSIISAVLHTRWYSRIGGRRFDDINSLPSRWSHWSCQW